MEKAIKVWIDEVFKQLGYLLEAEEGTSEGEYRYKYDPELLTVGDANKLMALAERDGLFTDYGVDLEEEVIYFKK